MAMGGFYEVGNLISEIMYLLMLNSKFCFVIGYWNEILWLWLNGVWLELMEAQCIYMNEGGRK